MTLWLTIIGIGDDGIEGLPPQSMHLLRKSGAVLTSKRVLNSADLPGVEILFWEDGYSEAMAWLMSRRGQAATVLASGDPMFFGIGSTLAAKLEPGEFDVLPSPSAFSLAASRLKWPLQDVACISLHGRPVEHLIRHLAPRARILALTSSGKTIADAASVLTQAGFGRSIVTVLEHLGGPEERVLSVSTQEVESKTFSDLNILSVECDPDPDTENVGSAPGLPDTSFEHDGQLTKREIRAAALAALRPYPDALLWDIGAGCGSIAVEWMRAARGARAIAIEENAERVKMICCNAKALGVPDLEILEDKAPEALRNLPQPDAVFIGGGISDAGVFETAFAALRRGGILVANAVTVEGETRLIELAKKHHGALSRIAVARAQPVGEFLAFKPFMPVTMLTIRKARI
jgi:precorrin-6B C5,15-methyltransferase / cobalt-precorrin-6B C5,C15-methyltransferase